MATKGTGSKVLWGKKAAASAAGRVPDEGHTPQGGAVRQVVLPIFAIAVCAALCALLFGSGTTLTTHGTAETGLDLSAAETAGAHLTSQGELTMDLSASSVTFRDVSLATRTIAVETYGMPRVEPVNEWRFYRRTPVMVTAWLVEHAADGAERLTQVDQIYVNPTGRETSGVLRLRTAAEPVDVRLTFSGAHEPWVLRAVTLNQSGFAFNLPQFLLWFLAGLALWLVVKKGLYRLVYTDEKPLHRLVMGYAVLVCVAAVLWLMVAITPPGQNLTWGYNRESGPEVLQSLEHYTHYYYLFDAWEHGQLALRQQPDARLLELDNPYDPVQREGIYYLWDVAYYDGQYYAYFGPAPMPLYFAIYWVTGRVPSPALACAVPALLAVVLCWGALRRAMRQFSIRPNFLLLMLGYVAVVAGSCLFFLLSQADTYVQPYLWAMVGMAGFICFFYGALQSEHTWACLLRMVLAGACVVLVAAARPLVALLCLAIAVPAGLAMLRDKNQRLWRRLLQVAALAAPVAAGALVLMWYNQARFGNVLDFGNQYQFTANDMTTQQFRISPVWLAEALFFYLWQPVLIQPRFPYVWTGISNQYYYGGPFYNYIFFGIMNFPLYWGLAGTPTALRRQPLQKKATFVAILGTSALILWVNYTISNLVYRYICDVTLPLAILALLVVLEVVACRPKSYKGMLYKVACGAFVATIIVGVLLCFNNERNFILYFNTDTYISVAHLLQLR